MTGVELEVTSGVALITIRNEPLNLFTRAVTRDLDAVLARVEADIEVRSVVVAGAGSRAFSAGSDIREFPALMEADTVIEQKLAVENATFDRLARLPQPTIAAIEGVALGGGAELALCCDYRIVSDNGRIGFPEIRLGTIPGSGGLARLPRLINPSIALSLLLDGDSVDAKRAHEIGLVNEIVMASTCVEAAIARARAWASRPGVAVRAIKQQICQVSRDQISGEMLASLDVSRTIFATGDMREGVAAFIGKRKPRFQHR